MKIMEPQFNSSQKITLGIAAVLRVANKNRMLIEPNWKVKLVAESHCLDEYFTAENFGFTDVKAGEITYADEIFVFFN